MVIDRIVENLVREKTNLWDGFLHLLCLEKLYKKETSQKEKKVNTIHVKESFSLDEIEPFRNKKWFWYKLGNEKILNFQIKRWFELQSSAFMR